MGGSNAQHSINITLHLETVYYSTNYILVQLPNTILFLWVLAVYLYRRIRNCRITKPFKQKAAISTKLTYFTKLLFNYCSGLFFSCLTNELRIVYEFRQPADLKWGVTNTPFQIVRLNFKQL